MMRRLLSALCVILLSSGAFGQTDFDELDKPPEGAHQGQMLLGGFVSFGQPYGDIIDAEQAFIDKSIYYFPSGIYKYLEVSHLAFSFGILFEYMPIDHIGARVKLKRTIVVQRSNFGPDYQNWTGMLYSDYSFYVGPAFHLTSRKRWDIVLIPMAGYAIGTYTASPVGKKILLQDPADPLSTKMTGSGESSFSTFSYGAELNFTFYFSRGLFISLGADWCRVPIDLGGAVDLVNPQYPTRVFMDGTSSGTMNTISFIVTAGYAFSN